MGRSLRFRAHVHQLFALLRLAFASAPRLPLNLAGARDSLVHSSIGTPSLSLRLLVDIRFQVLFHSPPGVLFTFPSRYYALSVTNQCLGLEGGPPGFPQDSSCLVVLWILTESETFNLHGFHIVLLTFPGNSDKSLSSLASPQPPRAVALRFGLCPLRSPLLWASRLISLPPGT